MSNNIEQPKHYAIDANLLINVLAYLGTQPHRPVRGLIEALEQLPPVMLTQAQAQAPVKTETKELTKPVLVPKSKSAEKREAVQKEASKKV